MSAYPPPKLKCLRSIGLIAFLLLAGCSQQPQNLAQVPDTTSTTMDVGVYKVESGNYVDVSSGKAIPKIDQLDAMLSDANKADDDFLRMVQSVGGFVKYGDLLDTESIGELRALHSKYGVGFTTKPPSDAMSNKELSSQAIGQCVPFFPEADRNRLHLLREWHHNVYIDRSGRPSWVKKRWVLPTYPPTSQRLSCQTIVGNYGPSPATDVGGHLIAAMLNGYGGRANMVPQNSQFNSSQWLSAEYTVRRCVRRRPTSLIVTPIYTSSSTVRPTQMWMDIKVERGALIRPFEVKVAFDNMVGGGPGTRGTDAAKAWANVLRPYCG